MGLWPVGAGRTQIHEGHFGLKGTLGAHRASCWYSGKQCLRARVLKPWVATMGKHVFPMVLETETPLGSKTTVTIGGS